MKIAYAVRHKASGQFWPESGKSYSRWSPPQAEKPGQTVRLFADTKKANAAIGQWMRGRFEWKLLDEYGERGQYVPVLDKSRKQGCLEVVPIQMVEIIEHPDHAAGNGKDVTETDGVS